MKHTPGLWKVGNHILGSERRFIEKDEEKLAIAEIIIARKEWKANAHLIATAPELLEALKLAHPIAKTLMDELAHKKATDWGLVNDGLIKIAKAIAKAEGR